MNKYVKRTIIILIIVLIAGGLGYYSYSRNKFDFNEDNATGNTPGNINNGGLFCESGGKIYFANPYDKDRLYVMNSDCTDAKKLNDDCIAYINVCNNYIYYVKNNFSEDTVGAVFRGQLFGLYRCDLNGQNCKALYDKLIGKVSLCGNYLYYQHNDNKTPLSLYKVRIDGKNNKQVSATPYNPSCVNNKKIYFADDTNNNRIRMINTANDSVSPYYDANAYMVDMEGSYMYYIDLDKDYSIMRLNTATNTVELVYAPNNGKIVSINVYGNKMFFQLESDSDDTTGLYRMNTDGTQIEYVAHGNLTKVTCTSRYTFFRYYEEPAILYRVPTSGTITKVEEIVIK